MYTVIYLNQAGERLWSRYSSLEKAQAFIDRTCAKMDKTDDDCYTDFVICVDLYEHEKALDRITILESTMTHTANVLLERSRA